jgi:hypothetical protein
VCRTRSTSAQSGIAASIPASITANSTAGAALSIRTGSARQAAKTAARKSNVKRAGQAARNGAFKKERGDGQMREAR